MDIKRKNKLFSASVPAGRPFLFRPGVNRTGNRLDGIGRSRPLIPLAGGKRGVYRADRFAVDEDYFAFVRPRKTLRRTNPGSLSLDSAGNRIVREYMKYRPTKKTDRLLATYELKRLTLRENLAAAGSFWRDHLFGRVWNYSIIGAILLGMISMSFIYRYLGPGALADSKKFPPSGGEAVILAELEPGTVLGVETEDLKFNGEFYFEDLLNGLIAGQEKEFEDKIREMVKGYPIETMVPLIAKKDPVVAAFLVSIARKESSWGKRVPLLDGQDCYNYWGYRGVRRLMGTGGHTCFNSRQDAVDTVAKRIEFLVNNKKLDTPAEMVIWKCGSDCEKTGGQASANKWIADVSYYFKKLNEE